MFTVKISETRNDTRGDIETIFEARQVRKAGPEIVVDFDGGGTGTWSVRPEAAGQDDLFMYVMNRFGATVATYRL